MTNRSIQLTVITALVVFVIFVSISVFYALKFSHDVETFPKSVSVITPSGAVECTLNEDSVVYCPPEETDQLTRSGT